MELRFDGKRVLVTGSSTGIGAAVARGFAAAGAWVAVHYHTSEKEAHQVAEDIHREGGEAIVVRADVRDPRQLNRLIQEVVDEFGGIDLLINNAGGLGERTEISEAADELYEDVMNVNMRSTFAACRAVVPIMRRQGGGSIVNLSSISGRTGGGGGSVLYAAAKAAVATFTRGLAKELAADGVRVNALSPGLIETPFHDKFTPDELYRQIEDTIPMGRSGRPEECVGPTLFLASDEAASYVTGQVLEVNGGQYTP